MPVEKPDPLMPACLHRLTLLTAAGLALLACTACGRRGSLQPPDATASARPEGSGTTTPASPRSLPNSVGIGGGSASADPDAVREGDELGPSATAPGGDGPPVRTSKGAKRGYTIPKQPFILDPIL